MFVMRGGAGIKTSGRKTDGEHSFSLIFSSVSFGALRNFFTAASAVGSRISTMHIPGSWHRFGSLKPFWCSQ